jgi:hypothetical protein
MSRQLSLPVVSRFLSALSNTTDCPTSLGGMKLFQRFVDFHTAGCYRNLMTVTAFGRALKDIEGITKSNARAGVVYNLDADAIRAFLIASNQYDDDASLL